MAANQLFMQFSVVKEWLWADPNEVPLDQQNS